MFVNENRSTDENTKIKGGIMKVLLLSLVFTMASSVALATEITKVQVGSCDEFGVSLNSVYSMKMYSNTSVKVFGIDMIEPAAASFGVAIAIDRGYGLADMESFCRFIPYLSSADVQNAKSKFDVKNNILTLTISASQTNGMGTAVPKTLVIRIAKGATTEDGLVTADLK